MLKKSALVISLAIIAGCSSVSSYEKIASNTEYTYDHSLKQSVIKGPIDESKPQGARVEDFKYDLIIKDSTVFANVSFNYKDKSPRVYTHVVDSMGVSYQLLNQKDKVLDCGINGTINYGTCNFEQSFTFQMPRDNRYQFSLIGKSSNSSVYFKINKDYIAVMDDFMYRLKTPRADYDEATIKKETLLAAKPAPVQKPSVSIPQPIVGNALEQEKNNAPKVSTVAINKPLIVNNPPIVKQFENNKQCNCSTGNALTVSNKPVLEPMAKTPFCSTMKFKNSCAEITSCREAYDQYSCGNKKLDPTRKGMPCPNVCKL
jgi:hypothetical protein